MVSTKKRPADDAATAFSPEAESEATERNLVSAPQHFARMPITNA